MQVNSQEYRTLWMKKGKEDVLCVIDQRNLPHKFVIEELTSVDEIATAIKEMHVRGAGLIGAVAAYGMYFSVLESQHSTTPLIEIEKSAKKLLSTRPTAINLAWAVEKQLETIKKSENYDRRLKETLSMAHNIANEDALACQNIGLYGVKIIENIYKDKEDTVHILTHCNAGWLAFVDYGTATAPIYEAHRRGIPIHVWVDETRPRNQGARLSAWELAQEKVPHTVISDNTGGHLMQKSMVDLVLVGSDRTTYGGDVVNKIGTYLKALAAKDNNIPFYAALPYSTIDWNILDGTNEIPIEMRSGDEVKYIYGLENGTIKKVQLFSHDSPAINYGFDITPSRFITGLITERGVCEASQEGIFSLYPEKRKH